MLHQLFYWHNPDYRIVLRNDDGSIRQVACANCECPKDALGYMCRHRRWNYNGNLTIECGSWDGFERYERGFDGPVVVPYGE
jgi:hypothetical protein